MHASKYNCRFGSIYSFGFQMFRVTFISRWKCLHLQLAYSLHQIPFDITASNVFLSKTMGYRWFEPLWHVWLMDQHGSVAFTILWKFTLAIWALERFTSDMGVTKNIEIIRNLHLLEGRQVQVAAKLGHIGPKLGSPAYELPHASITLRQSWLKLAQEGPR